MALQNAVQPRTCDNPAFDHGVRHGISWHLTGDKEYRQPTAGLIVDDKNRYHSEEYKEYQRNYQRSWHQRHKGDCTIVCVNGQTRNH